MKALVDELIRLEREVAERQNQILDIKARFIQAAEAELHKESGITADFVGCKWSWTGADGIVRVNFPNPRVIASFQIDAKGEAFRIDYDQGTRIDMRPLKRLVGTPGLSPFKELFATHYKPCKAFREVVPKLLGAGSAKSLLELCTEPSSPRVSTEVAEVVP